MPASGDHIPSDYLDLFEGPVVVTFTTVTANHAPQSLPVWCAYDGTHVIINSAEGRQKDKNVLVNKNVSVLAIDPTNPYRYVEVRGIVEERTTEGALDNINELAKLYTGKDTYFGGVAPAENADTEVRVLYKIKPIRVISHS